MTFRLVPMDRSHLAAVAAIERACFSAPWSEDMLAQCCSTTTHSISCNREDDAVMG
jgi:ribosomal-protein-alanine N-acetyltransferase